MPSTATVGTLRSRATQAGAHGAEEFADWLILDAEWFGPVEDLDRRTYMAWRRLALRIYCADPDLVVGADPTLALIGPLAGMEPRPARAAAPAEKPAGRGDGAPTVDEKAAFETDSALLAGLIMLTVLLLIALSAAAHALSGAP